MAEQAPTGGSSPQTTGEKLSHAAQSVKAKLSEGVTAAAHAASDAADYIKDKTGMHSTANPKSDSAAAAGHSCITMPNAAVLSAVFPGDWEAHDGVWMGWQGWDNKRDRPISLPLLQMVRAFNGHTHVYMIVEDAAEEATVRRLCEQQQVPLAHVAMLHVKHRGHWMRDMGPQFVRSLDGSQLSIVDWNFNQWGHEEPTSDESTINDQVHRTIASLRSYPLVPVNTTNGVRMIHEGGSVAHNGSGTMIAVESVAMQRNLGPRRFYPAAAPPLSDYESPTTYKVSPAWYDCRQRLCDEYARSLGVRKMIWFGTGVVEDNGTFRGPIGRHIHVTEYDGKPVGHPGVFTLYTTNGHGDEFIRFVSPETAILARSDPQPLPENATALQRLTHYFETENYKRLEAAYDILSHSTTADGKPIKVHRMPTPDFMYELMQPGDPIYDYYASYTHWDVDSGVEALRGNMLAVLPTSYVNYFPTNGVVLVARYWREGRPESMRRKDAECVRVITQCFPGRAIAPIDIENINMGGGGIHCSLQQQPAVKPTAAVQR